MRQAHVFNRQGGVDVAEVRVASHTCVATQIEILYNVNHLAVASRLSDLLFEDAGGKAAAAQHGKKSRRIFFGAITNEFFGCFDWLRLFFNR